MKDRVWAKGQLLVHKYDAAGRLYGREVADNIFLTSGINELWGLFSGASANHFDNTNARLGIGDSAAAAADTQTDLQAASNKTYKAMDATYPSAPAAKQIVYRATFGSADANYVWNEFVLKHNGTGICLDRGVQALGTKAPGTTWVATLTLSLA
jgi:hypothetical protein